MKTVQVILLSLISLVLAIGQVSVSHAAALAQDLFEFEWVQGAGGSGVDEGISIATDNAGNVIVVGDFFNEITIGNTTLTSLGSSDIFVAKYDPNGNFLWAFQIGGVSSDNVAGVAVNATDWIFIAGNFRNTVDFGDPAFGEGTLTSFGGPDIFIAQYYPNGDLFEVEQAGGTDYDYAKAITVTAVSAKPLVTGTFQTGQNGFNIGLGVYTSQGEHSAFVYRAFSGFNGWTAVIRGDRWEEGSAIAVDASNNVYVTGYFHNEIATTFNSGSGDGSPISLQSKGLDDSYVAKWNFSGELQWVEQITGSPSEYGVGIAADDFGNAIVTGKFNGTAIFGSDTLITDGDPHMFIAKYSGNGNFLWAQEGPEIFDGVAVDQNNDIVVTGNFAGSFQFGDIDLYSPGTQDNLFVAIYDGSGNPVWATQAGGPTQYNYINSNGIAIDGNNNILLTGSYNGNGYFGEMTLPSIGTNDDVFIAKMTLTEPQLAVSPLAIDFDTTRMNTWASRSVTITNIGGMDLIISDFSIYGDDWEQFGEQTWVLPYTLGFNQSRTLTVNFHPDDVGIFNATLHIYANVGDQQVSLTGRGGLPEISVTPDSVDFGVVSLEESGTEQLTISNTGPVDLHVTSIAISGVDAVNFSVETIPLPLTLSTDASQILNVSFAPDTVGGFSAYLDIESDDENVSIPLTAEGSGPILFVDPTLLEFGDILVGDSSDAMTITIRNIGSLPLEVSGIASSDSAIFSVSLAEDGGLRIDGLPRSVDISFTLNPGDSQNVIVTFTPNTAVEYDESLSISTNAGTGSVNLRGTGVAPELSVSSIFNFGNQLIGGNYSRNISVRNIGGYELNITSIVFGEADTAYFSVDTSVIKFFPSKFTVAPYGSHYVPVTFAPEDTISYNASVSIESDGGNATVQLQGTGIAFSVSPLSLNYGEVPFLTDSSTLTTTITNSLFDTLEIFDIISSDTAIFLVSLDGKNLIASETQDVLVTFAPLAETQYNEQLSISTNYGDEVVNLTGTGIPVPVISVTPSSIGFGEVAESNSVKDSVIVTNTGTGTLHVGSITTSGDEAAYFSATPTSLSVASGDTQFVEVTFTPVGDIQSYSATLNFSSDGGGATVSLSGSLAPPPLPELSVSPASLNWVHSQNLAIICSCFLVFKVPFGGERDC